jgi:hypothetical protein
MKHHPNLILYTVFKRYLSESEQAKFDKYLEKYQDRRSKYFYNGMLKFFDIEKIRNNPMLLEDIWIYNYCKYEVSNRVRKSGLISKYELEVFIHDEKAFRKYLNNRKKEQNQHI